MKRRSSAHNHQLSLDAVQLSNRTQDATPLPKYTQGQIKAGLEAGSRVNGTQPGEVLAKDTQADEFHVLAAEFFDQALTDARLSSAEAAYLFGVSESLVRRMRQSHTRERVSFVQLLKLPPTFHIALHRRMNRRFGFGRAALKNLMDVAGDLALVIE